jgi:hypothetical protein
MGAVALFGAAACCSINVGIEGLDSSNGIGALIISLIIVGIGIAVLVSARNSAKRRAAKAAFEIPRWEKAMDCWNKLYYCARDDGCLT